MIPAYFSFLFIPYVLALIIKSIRRHKVRAPFNYWQTHKRELGSDDTASRVARALETAEHRYNKTPASFHIHNGTSTRQPVQLKKLC
jgi:hypothetical protein